jgi:hypothetical protein
VAQTSQSLQICDYFGVKLTIETPAGKAITFTIQVEGIAESLDALAQP